jgi:hypothetical protein
MQLATTALSIPIVRGTMQSNYDILLEKIVGALHGVSASPLRLFTAQQPDG